MTQTGSCALLQTPGEAVLCSVLGGGVEGTEAASLKVLSGSQSSGEAGSQMGRRGEAWMLTVSPLCAPT